MNKFDTLFNKIINESTSETYIELTKEQLEQYLISENYFKENNRLNLAQLRKLYFDPSVKYLALIINDKLAAVSAYVHQKFKNKKIIFLNEVMGFKKGVRKRNNTKIITIFSRFNIFFC